MRNLIETLEYVSQQVYGTNLDDLTKEKWADIVSRRKSPKALKNLISDKKFNVLKSTGKVILC